MANIIKNSATKWNRKARLNVESMLHIGEGKSVTIAHKPQYELDTYSISFFASVNSTFSIAKGAFSFTQADLPGLKLGETALITITSTAILKNGIYVAANDKIFNNQSDIVLSGDFLIGHLAIFNKETSQQEIEFIHALGGVMPESSHASCVGHWPFTQRYGKTAWDVVEQYNYAKIDNSASDDFSYGWIKSDQWVFESNTEAIYLLSRFPTDGQGAIQNNDFYGNRAGIKNNESWREEITFDILEEFDGDGIFFQVITFDKSEPSGFFKTVGTHKVTLFVKNDNDTINAGQLRIKPAANTTQGKISNLKIIRKYTTLQANHADLINYDYQRNDLFQFGSNYDGTQGFAGDFVLAPNSLGLYTIGTGNSKHAIKDYSEYEKLAQVTLNINGAIASTFIDIVSNLDGSVLSSIAVISGNNTLDVSGYSNFSLKVHKTSIDGNQNVSISTLRELYELEEGKYVGVPDPATNSFWLDFYKKSPIDWIGSVDGDGNIIEKESGLPEIKKGITLDGVKKIIIPQAAMANIVNGNYVDIYLTYCFPEGVLPVPASSSNPFLEFINSIDNEYLRVDIRGLLSGYNRVYYKFFSEDNAESYVYINYGSNSNTSNKIINECFSIVRKNNSWHFMDVFKDGVQKYTYVGSIQGDPPFNWSNFSNNTISKISLFQITAVKRRNFDSEIDKKAPLIQNNNSLLKNNSDLIAWAYNPSVAVEDGENVKLTDLSGNGNHAIVTGFTGATPADQLANLKSKLIDINDLR